MATLDGLFDSGRCASCDGCDTPTWRYIHMPSLCTFFHYDAAKKAMQNRDLQLARNITEATVSGGVLAVSAGRLATVGKIGSLTTKALGGVMAGVGVITGVIDIVDAATEKAPPLPSCTRCSKPEAELPGCTLVCMGCGVECKSWRDASKSKHCVKVCDACWNLRLCMKCAAPASRRVHNDVCKMEVHRFLETKLYGTNKAGRITGSALSIAGTGALFVPVVGWAVGGALIAGGIGTSIGSSATAKPVVKIRCGACSKESEEHEKFLGNGCQAWCKTCCVPWSSTSSKCCMVLCATCEQGDQDDSSHGGSCTYKDTKTLYTPQPFYRCYTCFSEANNGCCANCADICHRGHNVVYNGKMNCFCDCGLKCSSSSCKIGQKCTYDVHGKVLRSQDWYECFTCWGGNSGYGCCAFCASECHAGHRLVQHPAKSVPHFYCDCGINKHKAAVCTFHSSEREYTKQPFYACHTCFRGPGHAWPKKGCCYQCMKNCHKGHSVSFKGEIRAYCDCGLHGCEISCKIPKP